MTFLDDKGAPMGTETDHAALARRKQRMVGVIDIGSNSLRLVIYDGISRAPMALFNEKVMCALGRGLNVTGRLNPDGVILAQDNIERFVMLARQLGVLRLDILATSAVRDAVDGPAFVADIEARCGVRVAVIDGAREGILAAAGVRAGLPNADGITGDLGGGSVELAETGPNGGAVASLPLGALRLMETNQDEMATRGMVDRAIADLAWLERGRGRPFYAVGGTWRALARIHMDQTNYPLHVIQGYELSTQTMEEFLDVLHRQSRRSLEKVAGISRKRLETVPMAAYVLLRLIRVIQPSSVIFSAYGLREGHLFELLPEDERNRDPLIEGALEMAAANPRFGGGGAELVQWTDPLFPSESLEERRLRHVAAILSDIGWSDHPDYRDEQVFTRCLRMPLPGLDHAGRIYLATVLHARYGGAQDAAVMLPVRPLVAPSAFVQARAVGAAFRLGYTLTGGAPDLLAKTGVGFEGASVALTIPEHTAIYTGEAVMRRLETLGRSLGRRSILRTASTDPVAA